MVNEINKKLLISLIIFSLFLVACAVDVSQMSDEEKEQYLFDKNAERLISRIETTLTFDGISNEGNISAQMINSSEEYESCTENKTSMVNIEIDITSKTTGIIDTFVADEFGWAMSSAETTFKNLYTDSNNYYYRKDVGITKLVFIKTPETTIDNYGNEVNYNPVNLGTISLCSSTEKLINWENMDVTLLKGLVIIDWSGDSGSSLGDYLEDVASSLSDVESALAQFK